MPLISINEIFKLFIYTGTSFEGIPGACTVIADKRGRFFQSSVYPDSCIKDRNSPGQEYLHSRFSPGLPRIAPAGMLSREVPRAL
jgi:hypothetical protein